MFPLQLTTIKRSVIDTIEHNETRYSFSWQSPSLKFVRKSHSNVYVKQYSTKLAFERWTSEETRLVRTEPKI